MKIDSNVLIDVFKELDTTSTRETTIIPKDGCWDLYSMDPSKTAVVAATIKAPTFTEGNNLEKDITVPVPFMLDVLQKDKICDLTVDNGSNLIIKYDKSKRTKRLYEPEDGPRPIPSLEGMSTCIIMSDDLINVAKQPCFTNITTDSGGITLRMTETGVIFEVISETESAEMTADGTGVLEDDVVQARFSIKILLPMLKVLPKGVAVSVLMKSDHPIHLSIDEDKYSMDIYAAPMIVEE